MEKSRGLQAFRAGAMSATLLTAACGGGGGSSGGGPAPATTVTPPVTQGNVGSTGLAAGPIAAPPPATFGTAPQQLALSGGPTIDGTTTTITFPLISTGLAAASPGLSALAASPGAIATLTNRSSGFSLQLVIPSANINTGFFEFVPVASLNPGDAPVWGLSYVVLGEWSAPDNGTPLQSETAFVFGYETPASAMPTSGTASFTGLADAVTYKSTGANIQSKYISGNAAASVNFASGQITGALTRMSDGSLPWNDVSLNANIASGTNRFSGSTAATSAPGTAFSLSGSATGHIDGAFYGPAAQNLGAVWSLSDGTVSAFGTVGAKQ